MLLDITSLDIVFSEDADTIIVGPTLPRRAPISMIPFPASFYPDDIQIQRVSWIKKGGNNIADYPNPPGEPEFASVQSRDVTRADPDTGRITVQTVHSVRTSVNRGLKTMDRIIWTDKSSQVHILVVEGPATPKGIGDIQYKVTCLEKV
jgi:hypothetical protein